MKCYAEFLEIDLSKKARKTQDRTSLNMAKIQVMTLRSKVKVIQRSEMYATLLSGS